MINSGAHNLTNSNSHWDGDAVFSYVFWKRLRCYIVWKKLDYLCNCESKISNVCNLVEGNCLQAMEIVYHNVKGRD